MRTGRFSRCMDREPSMAAVAIPTTAFGHRGFVGPGALRRTGGRLSRAGRGASRSWGRLHRVTVAPALVSVESVGEETRR